MIANLTGLVKQINPPELILQVGDIGYEILCPLSVFYNIKQNDNITLNTQLIVKEDSHTLFGFLHNKDKSMFKELIKISGIGPKVALSLLSSLTVDELSNCIENQDDATIARTPGIGKKTAQKLIIEMKNKIESLSFSNKPQTNTKAKDALSSLGFKPKEIDLMLKDVDNSLSTEEIIKYALKNK